MNTLADVSAVLLVGGMGTRLRSVVSSRPKPMASIGGTPFLGLLVRELERQGVRHLVMCTGYMANQIEDEFGDGNRWGLEISYSRELQPLGTGGALKLAQASLQRAANILVMNGDSFLEVDFTRLVQFHREHRGLASIAVREVPDTGRYGTVVTTSEGRLIGFEEKAHTSRRGLINAGIYVFGQAIFDYIPEGHASLERQVFPQILDAGVHALLHRGLFIDIGTPEDYARAQSLAEQLRKLNGRGPNIASSPVAGGE